MKPNPFVFLNYIADRSGVNGEQQGTKYWAFWNTKYEFAFIRVGWTDTDPGDMKKTM